MSIAMRTDPSAAGTAPRVVAAIQEILCEEAEAIVKMANALPHQELSRAVTLILECTGHIVVTGLGKAGLIGQKIAATLASTGTPSYFLHPSEALHGDLGCLRVHDVILALSSSGETVETVRTTKYAREQGLEAIAMTGRLESPLARSASCILPIGGLAEAGTLRLAPSSSTTCMLALGDALALAVSERRGFIAEDFARLHPGGTLGLQLSRVDVLMRPVHQCRIALWGLTTREVLVKAGRPGRRSGAIMLVDDEGKLRGIFTDSDLAKIIEHRRDEVLDLPIDHVMTPRPKTIALGERLSSAVQILSDFKLSELPVIDSEGIPVGLLDITDVLALMPAHPPAIAEMEDSPNVDERGVPWDGELKAYIGPQDPRAW